MKSTLEDLKNRRSCRKYTPEMVSEEELNAVVEAGTYAPTGMGQQSPVIVVVRDKTVLKRLSELNRSIMGVDFDPFYGAGTVLVVLAPKSAMTYREDGALVMGNLLNAAGALGLGSCWVHRAKETFETEEGKALLARWGLSQDYEGIGNCTLGYWAGEIPAAAPRKENYVLRIG